METTYKLALRHNCQDNHYVRPWGYRRRYHQVTSRLPTFKKKRASDKLVEASRKLWKPRIWWELSISVHRRKSFQTGDTSAKLTATQTQTMKSRTEADLLLQSTNIQEVSSTLSMIKSRVRKVYGYIFSSTYLWSLVSLVEQTTKNLKKLRKRQRR